jgi:hypothetical protein
MAAAQEGRRQITVGNDHPAQHSVSHREIMPPFGSVSFLFAIYSIFEKE